MLVDMISKVRLDEGSTPSTSTGFADPTNSAIISALLRFVNSEHIGKSFGGDLVLTANEYDSPRAWLANNRQINSNVRGAS